MSAHGIVLAFQLLITNTEPGDGQIINMQVASNTQDVRSIIGVDNG